MQGGEAAPATTPAGEAGGGTGPVAGTGALGAAAAGGCKDTFGRTRAGGGVFTCNGDQIEPTGGPEGDPAFGDNEVGGNGRPTGEAAGSAGGGTCTPPARPGETGRDGGRELGRDLLAGVRAVACSGMANAEAEGGRASAGGAADAHAGSCERMGAADTSAAGSGTGCAGAATGPGNGTSGEAPAIPA
jgi:hypothetical protein